MKGLYLVEPVVAIFAFSIFLVYPLLQQFIYRRLWEELTNSSYPEDNGSRCDPSGNSSSNSSGSNHSAYDDEVQRQASLFALYDEAFSLVPSLVVTVLLVAYSDRRGRKITIVLPLVGNLVYCLSFLAVSYFHLNVYLLLVASVASSLFGGVGALMGGCFAYVADRCTDLCADEQHKILRMAGLDMVIGLLSGVASLSTGYFLKATGFEGPILTGVAGMVLALLYAIFVLEESVKQQPDAGADVALPCGSAVWRTLGGIRRMLAGAGGHGQGRMRLLLLMLIMATFNLAYSGGLMNVTLYELEPPLCWDAILIGYGESLSTGVFIASFLGVAALTLCGTPPLVVILLSLLSVIIGLSFMAFAKTTLAMFLVRIPLLFAIMPFPVLRTLMSKLVSTSEQGALFACVVFLESLTGSIAVAIFSSIYAVMVSWWPGFTFLLAAGLCLIPCALVGVMALLKPDEAQEAGNVEEVEGLVSAEVEPDGGEDNEAMQA